jgi:hypothetical protein
MSEPRALSPSTLFWQRLITWGVWGLFALLVGWIVASVTAGAFGW